MSSMTHSRRRKKNKKEGKNSSPQSFALEDYPISSLEDIAGALGKIRFKKAFRGVDEEDVWKNIKLLDEMYRKVFFIQEQKYRLLLEKPEQAAAPGKRISRIPEDDGGFWDE